MASKLSQSEILRRLGYTPSPQLTAQINGNGKLQQYINQQAGLHGLPEPFAPSTGSAIIQDVLPLAALASGALLPGGAAEGATGAEAAGGAAAGGGAAGTAAKIAGKVAGNAGTTLETAGVIAGIWEALTDPQNWVCALEILGAAVAIYLGIRGLAGGYS